MSGDLYSICRIGFEDTESFIPLYDSTWSVFVYQQTERDCECGHGSKLFKFTVNSLDHGGRWAQSLAVLLHIGTLRLDRLPGRFSTYIVYFLYFSLGLFIDLFIYFYLFTYLFVYLCVYVFIYLLICLFIYKFIYVFIYLFIYLSTYLFTYTNIFIYFLAVSFFLCSFIHSFTLFFV